VTFLHELFDFAIRVGNYGFIPYSPADEVIPAMKFSTEFACAFVADESHHFFFACTCESIHAGPLTGQIEIGKRLFQIILIEPALGYHEDGIGITENLVIVVVVVLIAMWVISAYNNLVRMRNNRENAFANIDVQLKQRHDLIPQLVSTVKGYAAHEKDTLEKVIALRNAAAGATTINDKIQAENALSSALAGLKVTLEAYPDLKANQNFLQLQGEVSDIENKLAAVRRFFNSATKELNNAVQTFPGNIIAGMFGFHTEPMFEVPQEERAAYDKAPEINF